MRGVRPPLFLLCLALSACGVPLDAEPEIVDEEVVVADPRVEELDAEDLAAVTLYLVHGDGLAPVTRDLPAPPDVTLVLEALLDGTTPPEDTTGLRTSIPTGTSLMGVDVEGRTARVDLSRDFAAVGGEEEILAVAQIVLTVTGVEEIEAVLFELEGIPTDVPLPEGALSSGPVTPELYRRLIGP